MLPKDLTKDIKDRLNGIKGQIQGVINMLDEGNDPVQLLNQFKAINKGFEKAQHLLLDEVYRKALAIKIANALESCPGDCGQQERIATIRNQFPNLNLYELADKMKEVEKISDFIETKSKEPMEEITLHIDSMVCQGCAEKITDILKDSGGVKKVKTKGLAKTVIVSFDPDKTDEEKIRGVLTKAGYEPTKLQA